MSKPRVSDLCKNPALLLATWFGCGLSGRCPGTIGSLGALPVAYWVQANFGNAALFLFAWGVFFVGWWASNAYLARYTDTEDPGAIVIDEVAGQCLLLSALFPTWQSYLAAFIVFRLFDILKPWPVSQADRQIKGGLGVMLDDMLAAAYPLFALLVYTPVAFLTGNERAFSVLFSVLGK